MDKYIDADELLKQLTACKYPAEKTTKRQVTYNAAISDVCRSIDAMPAADVQEVRRGRWIRTGEDGYCSVCKCDMPMFRNDWEWEYTETPYCPNCGARMEETP